MVLPAKGSERDRVFVTSGNPGPTQEGAVGPGTPFAVQGGFPGGMPFDRPPCPMGTETEGQRQRRGASQGHRHVPPGRDGSPSLDRLKMQTPSGSLYPEGVYLVGVPGFEPGTSTL